MNCNHCGKEVSGQFCSNCGGPATLKRVDGHYVIHEIQHFLHFEKGIPYTVRELLIRPGKSIREFISVDRNRLVKPILFLIVCSLIYTFISHFFHVETESESVKMLKGSALLALLEWIEHHYGYANILMGLCIALWLKLFFGKYNYNFFELLILLCFVIGIGMLIFTIFSITEGLMQTRLTTLSTFGSLIYPSWAIGQFFDQKKVINYVKAFISYLLGGLMFFIIVGFIGIFIDVLMKH
ncbi:DUF3667 domain-containing protein [Fluviicola sp.]|uniref:DUF3667 domain-containing protein n=1 Tax=Fluviicola sp. TaxID=1917219 RepID=UPI002602A56B|nr:DUF3667 domain-containing protein [Fluviicola sp.]